MRGLLTAVALWIAATGTSSAATMTFYPGPDSYLSYNGGPANVDVTIDFGFAVDLPLGPGMGVSASFLVVATNTETNQSTGTFSDFLWYTVNVADFPGDEIWQGKLWRSFYQETQPFGSHYTASFLITGPSIIQVSVFLAATGMAFEQTLALTVEFPDGTYPVGTPLPATLPLFASGLGAIALLGWRRRRAG